MAQSRDRILKFQKINFIRQTEIGDSLASHRKMRIEGGRVIRLVIRLIMVYHFVFGS